MSSSRTTSVLTVAAVTVLGGLFAYAVYFDYKRRNDSDFRKKLRKDKKKVTKQSEQAKAANDAAAVVSAAEIKTALLKVREEEVPPTPDEKEAYFMMQVQVGDQLLQKGPNFLLPAAMAFFRALRVYPSPVEFIMMLQQTLPETVFKVFMEMVNADVASRVEGYYDYFPPKRMNVSVQHVGGQGNQATKKILIAQKDFAAGDVIYMESPVVVALDADLEGNGTHCSYCFKRVEEGSAIAPENDKLGSVFCSQECKDKAYYSWQNLYFALDPVLPPDLDMGMGAMTTDKRDAAQNVYLEWRKAKAKQANILGARFIGKQVALETQKMSKEKAGPLAREIEQMADGKDLYGISDHIERLRFVEGHVTDEEVKLLREVLGSALPGLEQSVQENNHAVLVGKMAYNAIGVCPNGGRDDKPASTERPEDQERTRTPHGTSRQVGSGVYFVSSYIAHSCDPSARPVFESNNELQLIANRDIKKGDEITIAWVDVTQHEGESTEEARRGRRVELARGWKFKCECERCVAEVVEDIEKEDAELGVQQDESKVENVMRHERVPDNGPD
ncbi:MAS20-domain-containing protein [Lentinus tigrinus ALCF2SS1-7]|uniref:MAS20-domain-containing protein n=1 Tax=Lentinus tigrinus ALCF2SS1-6 TaxID=1328759 RepID=A0A5C2STM5_9APHY|nr:MAS20-domain-containing protein [Lentinus tigrinus ALCF2SS1-6]RPD80682.1 MAS20-domain-containing protein [Lentinus tigrinus ALCF2SS1-7]